MDLQSEKIIEGTSIDKKKLTNLKNKISCLSKIEFIEIFKIIKEEGNKYTENKNGIFINMNKLSINTISKIDSFINYTLQNKTDIENENLIRENIKDFIEKEITNTEYSSNENNSDIAHKSSLDVENYNNNNEIKEEIIYEVNSEIISFDNQERDEYELNEIQKEISAIKFRAKNKGIEKKKNNKY